LHLWTQVVGKVRLELSPFLNHWWHVALYVTSPGLTTSAIPYQGGIFDVTFDFVEHTLFIRTSEGTTRALPLIPRSVAAFYREFTDSLHALGIQVSINPLPNEVPSPIRCDEDEVHASYDPIYAQRFWHILVQIEIVDCITREAYSHPEKAFYSQELGEFLLRYDDMRAASSPERAALEFFQSTYEAGTTLAQWDRGSLERKAH
jgi:hypothetical protein